MALDQAIHRSMLVQMLKSMVSDQVVGPVVGFKGGTAVYLLYGLPRFSVDLDFDLRDPAVAEMVYARIGKILAEFGQIKSMKHKRWTLVYIVSYEHKDVQAPNIKVEVNTRVFGSGYELKSYLGIPLMVMVREDMVAHKLLAMVERIGRANRDLFDAWWFLSQNWPVNEAIVRERTGMEMREFWETCIEKVSAVPRRGILAGLGELLTEKQKAWVKEKLVDELVFQLRLRREMLG